MSAPSLEHLHRRVRDASRERFACEPAVTVAAPGRVNLIGEHTDYNLGLALPVAIDRYTLLAVSWSDSDESTLVALDRDETVSMDLSQPQQPRAGKDLWTNYIVGVYEQFRERLALERNIDLALTSSVPIGAGLSSSAALEVATGAALLELGHGAMERLELARLCRRAENEFVGVPCGLMDQLTSASGRAGHALFIDFFDEEVVHVPLPAPEDLALLLANTRVKHNLASTAYARRREECQQAAAALGLRSLRDATPAQLLDAKDKMPDVVFNRAWHVVGENARVVMAAEALEAGQLHDFGRLMDQSHISLRDQYEVSCPELDVLVELAQSFDDERVYGSRMTGGGFGGCTITACHPSIVQPLRAHLRAGYEQRCKRRPAFHLVTASAGVRTLS